MKIRDAIAAGIAHLAQNRLRAGLVHPRYLHRDRQRAMHDGNRRRREKKLSADGLETLGGIDQVQFPKPLRRFPQGTLAPNNRTAQT